MTDEPQPSMFRLAREYRGLNQGELAKAAGLTQPTVSRIESGMVSISNENLQCLASALEFPPSFFSQSPPAASGATCVFHRKLQSLGVRETRRIHAIFDVMLMELAALYQNVEFTPSKPPIPRIDSDAFDGNAEHIAELVRSYWRLPPGPIANVTSMLEDAGVIVVRVNLGTDKIDAISQLTDKMPPVIFVNASKPTDRMRFTLCHELGHLVMHSCSFEDMEAEANRFASELLMPTRDFRAELRPPVNIPKLSSLKLRWRVSVAAMVYRAGSLGIISDRRKRTLYSRISQLGWRKGEPDVLSPEEPKLVSEIIDFHTQDLGYSIEDLAELAHVTPGEFRAGFLRRAAHLRLAR